MRPAARTNLPRMGSEYSDEVTKTNKKEDLMLERKLRVLDRQERVAQNMVRKNIREIERLKVSIHDTSSRATDLCQYDQQKYQEKLGRYGLHHQRAAPASMKRTQNPNNIRLPPLDGSRLSASQSSTFSASYRGSYQSKEKVKRRNSLPPGVPSEQSSSSVTTSQVRATAAAPTLNM